MGCSPSHTRRVTAAPKEPVKEAEPEKKNRHGHNHTIYAPSFELKSAYSILTSEVRSIKCPNGMIPVVCYDENAFPLCAASMSLGENEQTEIQFPVAAFSILGGVRIFCCASYSVLTSSYFDSENTSRLIRNVFSWMVPNGLDRPVLLLDFPQQFHREIKSCFRANGFQYKMENNIENVDLSDYTVVFASTDVDTTNIETKQKLTKFVKDGGGLGVFYVPGFSDQEANDEVKINPFLRQFGFAFTYCHLLSVHSNRISVDVFSNSEKIKFCHFLSVAYQFNEISHHKEIQTADLDDIVTTLRYYILILEPSLATDSLITIINHAYTYLKKTGFVQEGTICPLINHSIMLLLVHEIFQKLPPEKIQAAPEVDLFPGKTGEIELSNHKFEINLHEESWIPTGLWLPAGAHAKIICTNPPRDLRIQIGSHTVNLLSKQGPWKRWPIVTMSFPLLDGENEIVSPFGGIVYILVNELDESFENPYLVSFENFTRHPRAVVSKPEMYETTKIYEIPWAELRTKTIIFTLPSKELQLITDVDDLSARVDKIVMSIIKFMCYSMYRSYRIVFDVETVNGKTEYSYPIVMIEDYMKDILIDYKKPTRGMFQMIVAIAVVSIRENYFEETTELAIATLVATIVFKELFPGFDPFVGDKYEIPPLFQEIWLIHSRINNTIIPQLLHESQEPDAVIYDSPEDMWVRFVRDLSYKAKFNFSKLMERAKPIPMNIMNSLAELPNPPIRDL